MPELHPSTPAAPRKRDAWEVQRGVLFALVLREMKGRVGGQWVGAVWTLIEPLMHVLVMLTIFTTIRAGGMLGVEMPVFLATGLLPYFLFQHLSLRLMDGIDANRGLYAYRQVLPFDTLMSRALVELMMNALVYAVTLGLLGWLGFHILPADPLEAMGVHALLFLLGAGLGVFAAVVSHRRPRVRSMIRISMLPMYIISGVIFPIHVAPPEVLHWLLYNPLLHLIELSRHAFIADYPALDGVNLRYPLLFALSLCALALALYRVDRLRLVTST
ncbi:MAG: ABC transporter permease [Burkholderiaceae bacterium]|nr:ABC transporter permease [Rhodoferax sp.]MCP5272975.1 ABC transporter permease [Burkholderiaceae bacterium]